MLSLIGWRNAWGWHFPFPCVVLRRTDSAGNCAEHAFPGYQALSLVLGRPIMEPPIPTFASNEYVFVLCTLVSDVQEVYCSGRRACSGPCLVCRCRRQAGFRPHAFSLPHLAQHHLPSAGGRLCCNYGRRVRNTAFECDARIGVCVLLAAERLNRICLEVVLFGWSLVSRVTFKVGDVGGCFT